MNIMGRTFTMNVDDEGVASLSFPEATEDDEGDYICKITTELGTAKVLLL